MNRAVVCALLGALALAGPVWADEEKEDDGSSAAEPAIGFASRWGTTGFGKMIDGRTPGGTLQVRGGLRYEVRVEQRDFQGALEAERTEQRHDLVFYAGASALGLADVGLRLPYVWEDIETDIESAPNDSQFYNGWGDLEAAGKVTIELGPFSVAPYLAGKFPIAEPEVEDLWTGYYGVAGTFSIFNEYLSVHGNLAAQQREGETWALEYRVGGAFVVWADHNAVVRIYGYADFTEWEGSPDTEVLVDAGVQGLILDYVTLELGVSVRVLEADRIDERTTEDLEDLGVYDDHFDDEGTVAVHIAVGFVW